MTLLSSMMGAVRLAALLLPLVLAACGPATGGDPNVESLTFQARGSWQSEVVIWGADSHHLEVALFVRESPCRVSFHGVYADLSGVRLVDGYNDHIVPCRAAPQL